MISSYPPGLQVYAGNILSIWEAIKGFGGPNYRERPAFGGASELPGYNRIKKGEPFWVSLQNRRFQSVLYFQAKYINISYIRISDIRRGLFSPGGDELR
jgi:hypothetical protein